MPNNTLTNLIDRAKQRADMEGSTFCTDTEITGYINQGIRELHDILVTLYEDYFVTTTTYTLPASNPGTLPANFYKAIGVDFETGGITYRVRPYSFQERNMLQSPYTQQGKLGNLFYNIRGTQIFFIPTNTLSGTITLHYAPMATEMEAGHSGTQLTTLIPQITYGYEEYIVCHAAIQMLVKEESDVSVHLAERERQKQRIMSAATNRDAGESYAITDVDIGSIQDDFIYKMT
tara:strand:- start:211 stop:909 length:699 start_codon:yes stop_codon:yes gene_type:complete